MGISQILFLIVLIITISWAVRLYGRIFKLIHLGKEEDISGDENRRWKNVFLVAFGQKKMFKRFIPAILHLFIYVAFVITQIELIEIFIDGLTGYHRIFAPYLGIFYTFIISFIEILSILALIATIIFLIRRNIIKTPRLHSAEMTTWPKLDANLILFGEIALIVGIFCMNGADIVLQEKDPTHYTDTGNFVISGTLGPALFGALGKDMLVLIERFGWWLHLLTVLAFILYIPISKHLHIFLSFPNVYYAKLDSRGAMENMPEIQAEVRSMMGLDTTGSNEMDMSMEIPEFGAKDIMDLSWKNILDAFSCTECGRCTSVCPANLTGKKLSPRKIMMDIRDRTEEIGNKLDSGRSQFIDSAKKENDTKLSKENFNDNRSLFDYISKEEIRACTTCNACVEACPVMINPLEPILKLRRYEILTESSGPQDWLPMFNSLESTGAVWQMPQGRDQWIKDLQSN